MTAHELLAELWRLKANGDMFLVSATRHGDETLERVREYFAASCPDCGNGAGCAFRRTGQPHGRKLRAVST